MPKLSASQVQGLRSFIENAKRCGDPCLVAMAVAIADRKLLESGEPPEGGSRKTFHFEVGKVYRARIAKYEQSES